MRMAVFGKFLEIYTSKSNWVFNYGIFNYVTITNKMNKEINK